MKILYLFSVISAILTLLLITINPVTGFLSVMFFKPIIDTGFYISFGPGLSLTKLYGVAVPLIIFYYMFFSGKVDLKIKSMPYVKLWLVYSVYILFFSSLVIVNEGVVSGLDVFFSHINGIVGFYMLQAFIRNDDDMKKFIIIIIAAGVFPISTTLFQIATGYQYHHLGHQVSEMFVRSPGLYYLINTIRYYSYQTIIGILLYTTFVGKPVTWKKYAGWLYLLLIFIVLFKTYSKAGYFATAVGGLIWIVLNKKYNTLIFIIIAGVILTPFYTKEILDVVYIVFHREVGAIEGSHIGVTAFGGRLLFWLEKYNEWAANGLFAQLFGSGQNMKGAHNDYLMMLWEGGIFGLAIYIILLGTIGIRLLVELRRKVDPLIVAATMLYAAFMVDTIGLVPSIYPHFQWLVWGFIGLAFRERVNPCFGLGNRSNIITGKTPEPIDKRILSRKM